MPDFASISASLDAIAAGSLIVVVDDDSETATGALAGAAQFMDTEKLVWLSRRVTGLIGVPMSVDRADELELDLMVAEDEATGRGAFTVSVDLIPPIRLEPSPPLLASRSPPMILLVLATSSRCGPERVAC